MLYMGAVGLVFAPLAPLIAVAASLVFFASSFVYKYQLMFVFTTKVESAGVSAMHFASFCVELMSSCIAHVESCHQSSTLCYGTHAAHDDFQYVLCSYPTVASPSLRHCIY